MTQHFAPLITAEALQSLDMKNCEVSFIKVPKEINTEQLINRDILSDFKVDNVNYCTSIEKEAKENLFVTLTENNTPVPFKLKSKKVYTIRERFIDPPRVKLEPEPRYVVPQITKTKLRHPIYGVDFVKDLKRKGSSFTESNLSGNLSQDQLQVRAQPNQSTSPRKKQKFQ